MTPEQPVIDDLPERSPLRRELAEAKAIIAALQRENAQLRAIAQELEFGVSYYNDSDLVCPMCRQLPPSDRDPHATDRGHLPDCALAAALTPSAAPGEGETR